VHLLANELCEYQNAWCNDKNWKHIILTLIFILTEGTDMLANNEKCIQGEVILRSLEK